MTLNHTLEYTVTVNGQTITTTIESKEQDREKAMSEAVKHIENSIKIELAGLKVTEVE